MEVERKMAIKLTDAQQALFMLLIFILPAFAVWAGSGFPVERTEIGFLAASVISGILVFIKEMLGWKPSEPAPVTPA